MHSTLEERFRAISQPQLQINSSFVATGPRFSELPNSSVIEGSESLRRGHVTSRTWHRKGFGVAEGSTALQRLPGYGAGTDARASHHVTHPSAALLHEAPGNIRTWWRGNLVG